MAKKFSEAKPPVILIDELALKSAYDAGPVCECEERYKAVKDLKPFTPGGTLPFAKKHFPGEECLEVLWAKTSIQPRSLQFVRAVAIERKDVPEKYRSRNQDPDELMFIRSSK